MAACAWRWVNEAGRVSVLPGPVHIAPNDLAADRLRALDVFRGATVALMILVNNPGSWAHLYPPLAHADWHGVTPTDLVFPFFLFAVGNALALVMPRWLAGATGADRRAFWLRVARRTVLIFVIGLGLNAAPFVRWDAAAALVPRDWETLRLMGVLQRIALAFGGAAVIVALCSRGAAAAADTAVVARRVLWAAAVLLLGYWGLCEVLAQGADPYSLEGFFGTHLDRAVLGAGHLYRGEGVPFDPEGLAGTVPAVAQVLLGWWAGQAIAGAYGSAGAPSGTTAGARRLGIDTALVARLCLAGVVLGVLAYAWQLQMPLNKKLWTSSYVLHTTALALLGLAALLALLHAPRHAPLHQPLHQPLHEPLHEPVSAVARGGIVPLRDRAPLRALLAVCEAFGRNALGLFVLAGLVPRFLALWRWPDGVAGDGTPRFISLLPWLYRTVFADLGSDPRLGSLLFALAHLAVYALIAVWLHRRGWYWRV